MQPDAAKETGVEPLIKPLLDCVIFLGILGIPGIFRIPGILKILGRKLGRLMQPDAASETSVELLIKPSIRFSLFSQESWESSESKES